MSTIVLPGQQLIKEIILHTRDRKSEIPNGYSSEVTRWDRHVADSCRAKYPHATYRTGLSPVYNCHGMTFASRRTCVDRPEAVWTIINDDDFQAVANPADVLPGDVVLYVSDSGDVEHSGIVVEIPDPEPGVIPTPRVLSKWGHGPEVVHLLYDCPYRNGFARVLYFRVTQ